ncbi:DUF488 domain-containing protein [Olivibacter ginsenosidimutans]|uniref:DUF488 domain-containing protein n=1 Tax=Olivibacter ginsenosidimutans TaxID=1176537 RepID=A0ABP9BIN6_9SPHI
MITYKIKRIYETVDEHDGFRVLVDRLWPRGIKKEDAKIDLWLKNLAPSTDLRKWFNHDDEKWTDFKSKYQAELNSNSELKETMRTFKQHKKVTFLYAAQNEKHNNAAVLKAYLEKKA